MITVDADASGKSPTSPASRFPTSCGPSESMTCRMTDANAMNFWDVEDVEGSRQSCETMPRSKSRDAKMMSECTRLSETTVMRKAVENEDGSKKISGVSSSILSRSRK